MPITCNRRTGLIFKCQGHNFSSVTSAVNLGACKRTLLWVLRLHLYVKTCMERPDISRKTITASRTACVCNLCLCIRKCV